MSSTGQDNCRTIEETIGKRIARLRKEKGKTQVELAKKMGLTQGLISDYELDKLRPYHEMIARFAVVLDVSADELLGLTPSSSGGKPSLKLTQRMKKIEDLPPSQQKVLLKTIDTFLKGAQA